jgi:hypothetical protein
MLNPDGPVKLYSDRQYLNSGTDKSVLSQFRVVKQSRSTALSLSLTLLLSACGGGSGDPMSEPQGNGPISTVDTTDSTSCETSAQNQWVDNTMLDYYLFYDQVPAVDPQAYENSDELIRALRFEERDPYSHLRNASVCALQFDAGREFSLG